MNYQLDSLRNVLLELIRKDMEIEESKEKLFGIDFCPLNLYNSIKKEKSFQMTIQDLLVFLRYIKKD